MVSGNRIVFLCSINKKTKLMNISNKIVKGLDRLTGSASTKFILNRLIGEYGKMIELTLDTKNKKIIASALLKGENVPIKVIIDKYEIIKKNSASSIVVKEASSDKAWLNAILKSFIVGKSWDIPTDRVDFIDDFLG